MYTNAIENEPADTRHVWYARQHEAMVEARQEGAAITQASRCGDVHVHVLEGRTGDRLIPIAELPVENLAHFLAHKHTCGRCRERVIEETGLEWRADCYEDTFTVESTVTPLEDQ